MELFGLGNIYYRCKRSLRRLCFYTCLSVILFTGGGCIPACNGAALVGVEAAYRFGYAAIVAVGGVIGYVKAGSAISLGMGLLFGSLSAVGAYQMSNNPNNFHLLLGTSGVLLGVMGYRFINSGKFMPAGLVAALSLVMFGRLAMRMLQ